MANCARVQATPPSNLIHWTAPILHHLLSTDPSRSPQGALGPLPFFCSLSLITCVLSVGPLRGGVPGFDLRLLAVFAKGPCLECQRSNHWSGVGRPIGRARKSGGVADQFRASSHRRCSLKWMSLRLPRNIGLTFAHSCTFTAYFQATNGGKVSVTIEPRPLHTPTPLSFAFLRMCAKLIRESLAETDDISSNIWRGIWQEMKLVLTNCEGGTPPASDIIAN